MSRKIWVYIDHFRGRPSAASLETLGAAELLAETGEGQVTAVLIGSELAGLAGMISGYGVAEILLVENPALRDYCAEPYADVLSGLAREFLPEVILFPATSRAEELAAMCAVDLHTGVLTGAVRLETQAERVIVTRYCYGGRILSRSYCQTSPQIITVARRVFSPPETRSSAETIITPVPVQLDEADLQTQVLDELTNDAVDLADARIIVAGGRGLAGSTVAPAPTGLDPKEAGRRQAQRGFQLLSELAQVLGGAVGATRAAVDEKYIPYAYQIGQTGKNVAPDLYLACGISGAIHHLAGMRASRVVVAINPDSDAPIFRLARFAVAADLYEIVPALIAALRKYKGII